MPSATQLYNVGKWLNAADLVNNPAIGMGKRVPAIVHQVEEASVGQGNDQKTQLNLSLVSRQGQPWPKTLLMNKTNTLQIVAAYGDDYLQWPGKAIEIWAELVPFQGKLVPGLKVVASVNGAAVPGVGQQAQAPMPPAQAPMPPAGAGAQAAPPSASAVAGLPPGVSNAPAWPRQQQGAPLEDDDIPF